MCSISDVDHFRTEFGRDRILGTQTAREPDESPLLETRFLDSPATVASSTPE